jgi:hypothetical protein
MVEYNGRKCGKRSPGKETLGGRKSVRRIGDSQFIKDRVVAYPHEDDLLQPFERSEELSVLRGRLAGDLAKLDPRYRKITGPGQYPVEWDPMQ